MKDETINVLEYIVGGLPCSSAGKESIYNAEDPGSILGSGRSPGEGNDNPLQCSCLGNPTDRGALWATVQGIAKSWTGLGTKHASLYPSGFQKTEETTTHTIELCQL